MSSPLSNPSLDELASAVLAAIAPLGHPVAERYVRSLRFIGTPGLRAEDKRGNEAEVDSVYAQLQSMSPRERDLACLRDATSVTPQLPLAWLTSDLETAGPLRGWAALISAARGGRLESFLNQLEPHRGSSSPLASLVPVAARLARSADRSGADSVPLPAPESGAGAPATATVTAALPPTPRSTETAPSAPSAPVAPIAADPTPVSAAAQTDVALPLAAQVASLEATARKTGDPTARAALYYRVGRIHEDELGAPRSALESYLLAFMLDPRPYAHFVSVERACLAADRHKDLVHIYQSGLEAIDEGADYEVPAAALLWRCLQTQDSRLLRPTDADNSAARLALEPTANASLLQELQTWLQGRDPRNEALIALVSSRLPAP